MIKSIFLFYLFVSMISLITEALVVTRALWNGFSMTKKQTLCIICASFLPIIHFINIMSNLILIFECKDNFILDMLKFQYFFYIIIKWYIDYWYGWLQRKCLIKR